MTKENYISPYEAEDLDTIINQLIEDGIIDGDYDEDEYDELDAIVSEAIDKFNTELMEDESIEADEELDYQDLRDDMYAAIREAVEENYSNVIK